MRIEFVHVDLIEKNSIVKRVSDIKHETPTLTNYNDGHDDARLQEDIAEKTKKNYSDIQSKLHDFNDDDSFLSSEDLNNLKSMIESGNYPINIRVLAICLAKYTERG
jgi:hypothetical protein